MTAAVTGRERVATLEAVRSGEVDIVVGTHALVQEGVAFGDLSLAVVDEQHRFGVHQRIALKEKGVKSLFLVGSDYVFPQTANKEIKAYAAANGIEIKGEEYAPLGSTSFATIVAKVRDAGAGAVFIA